MLVVILVGLCCLHLLWPAVLCGTCFTLGGCSLDVICGELLGCRLLWFISVNGYFLWVVICLDWLFYSFGILVICLVVWLGLNSVAVLTFYFEL